MVELLIGGFVAYLVWSSSTGSSSTGSSYKSSSPKDLRKSPNPKYVPYYAWIYPNDYFLADAELNGKLYRIHINGQLTSFDPVIRVETTQSMSIYGQWDKDTIFFTAGKCLYLVNERLHRYNKYMPEVNCWVTISEYDFKMAHEKHKNEQRQLEQSK